MTRIQKDLLLILLFLVLLFKDAIIGIMVKEEKFKIIENNIQTLEKQEILKLNEEIQKSYGYTDFYPYNLEHSKVLYRTPYDYKENITIYKGKNNNIKVNQLVINEFGLVGIIDKVHKNTSEVKLINNPDFELPVKINNSYGTLINQDNNIIVKGLKTTNKIEIGEKIYTSDLASFPQNILIGEVETVNLDNYEIEQIIHIKLAVDLNDLNYLSIITTCRGLSCS